jgi:hypothetical protein
MHRAETRIPQKTTVARPAAATPPRGPTVIDPQLLKQVSGGLPKGGWAADPTAAALPKGGW